MSPMMVPSMVPPEEVVGGASARWSAPAPGSGAGRSQPRCRPPRDPVWWAGPPGTIGASPHLRGRPRAARPVRWTPHPGVAHVGGVASFSSLPVYWRVCLINAALFLLATVILVVSPTSVGPDMSVGELGVLALGLGAIMVANALLLRSSLVPLDRLVAQMQRMDLQGLGRAAARHPRRLAAAPGHQLQRHVVAAGAGARPQQRRRAGRPGGRAAPDRPGAARRDRPGPHRRPAGAAARRRPTPRPRWPTSCGRCRRRPGPACTRSARSPAGSARGCCRTSAWSARSRRWPPT